MVWWMIVSGVCFFGGFYVGMAMMAIMSVAKRADEEMVVSDYMKNEYADVNEYTKNEYERVSGYG